MLLLVLSFARASPPQMYASPSIYNRGRVCALPVTWEKCISASACHDKTFHLQLPKLWQDALKKGRENCDVRESFFEGGRGGWAGLKLTACLPTDCWPGQQFLVGFHAALMQSSLFARPGPASWVSCWAQCQPVVNYHRPTDDLTADAWPTPGSCRRQFFQNYFNLFGEIQKFSLLSQQKKSIFLDGTKSYFLFVWKLGRNKNKLWASSKKLGGNYSWAKSWAWNQIVDQRTRNF